MPAYHPQSIEPKWQKYWEDHQTFRTPDRSDRPKFYILDMFPYPSGAGLHVGHPEGYTATDILARYRRMKGFHVLHPMGWDAFGLPAEQYAIQTGAHPAETTQKNIDTFRRQIKSLGFSYDWEREIDTTDPRYFKWTQWIFLLLYDTWYDMEQKKGRPIAELPIPEEVRGRGDAAVAAFQDLHRLAYQTEAPVNWCPALGTVLANEEVIDGKSERGNHPVVRMPLKQWMLRITAYAERLLHDLEPLDWSEAIKEMQRNWIGRSEGAEIRFALAHPPATLSEAESAIRVFTTRPDTLYGATYMVLAPEHPLVSLITTSEQQAAVRAYQEASARKSDLERTDLIKKKTGVFTGAFAINPATKTKIPIWIADYVLASYGTGAIMAVPGQDQRDWEFAVVYNLPIVRTVQPPKDWTGEAYLGDGPAIESGFLNGLYVAEAKQQIIAWLEENGLGQRRVQYKLRDWLFSRQRYWGEPIPLLHEVDDQGRRTGRIVPLSVEELPLRLPDMKDYKPSGQPEPPLGKAVDWVHVERHGKRYQRETNTMPQWAGSCWYYLRFIDPRNDRMLCDPEKQRYWLPVDLYVGGAEHAVLHLLYARFWHKVLFDRGYVSTAEPFQKLVNQGMILGEMEFTAFRSKKGHWVSAERVDADSAADKDTEEPYERVKLSEEQVEKHSEGFVLKDEPGVRVDARAYKMSKARGNVINPDQVVGEYGADSMRLYEMFMGPLEATKPWSMRGVEGVFRFLNRVWRVMMSEESETPKLADAIQDVAPEPETERFVHLTIKRVTDDLDGMRFNTAISAMMELTNHLTKLTVRPRSAVQTLVLLLAPFAPHLAEELWERLGHQATLAYEPWPVFDPGKLKADQIEMAVQINGKVRARIMVPAEHDAEQLTQAALAHVNVQEHLKGKTIKKTIAVPNKLISFVVA